MPRQERTCGRQQHSFPLIYHQRHNSAHLRLMTPPPRTPTDISPAHLLLAHH